MSEKSSGKQSVSWAERCRKFLAEVRKEVSQVVWPTRREVVVTTVIVGLFALIISLYLLVVDRSILFIVQKIMGA